MRRHLSALLLSLCLASVAHAAPMTNDDVIKLVRGGLGEATILQAIDGAEPGFDTSTDGLVKLKGGGVSDTLIQRILSRKGAAPAAAGVAPPAAPVAAIPVGPVACPECGTVTGVQEQSRAGHASGVGAVAGGVIGGVLGRNLGGSKHRTAGTVLGAVGGGLAGHQIEKSTRGETSWQVSVRFDDGNVRVFTLAAQPAWTTGSRVRLVNGALAPF